MDYDNTQTLQSLHLHIPEEIMEEIMYRLPVKSLMRFKSVSKSWRSLIDSDRFIKNHYRINSTSLAHHRVIFNWPCWGVKQCSLQSILNRACTRPFHLDKEMDNDEWITRYSLVIGCCKGLLCLVFAGVYTLWNPATNVSFCLPDIPQVELSLDLRVCEKHGFGWDETSDAYKVFALSSDDHNEGTVVARVYSSKTNSWKTLVGGHGSLSTYNYTGMYACGSFHWVMAGCEEIECFELKSEAFRKMEMPSFEVKYKGYEGLRLGEVRGCLSVMRERMIGGVVDLWVMKNESWQKLNTFTCSSAYEPGFVRDPDGKMMMLLLFEKSFWACYGGGVPAVKKLDRITRDGCCRSFVKGFLNYCMGFLQSDFYQTYLYVETLVSPLPHDFIFLS